MYKIIGGDHKEYGPATADELRQWIAEGRLSGQSLVQLEGSGEWKPLEAYAEFTAALGAQVRNGPPTSVPPPMAPASWADQILKREPQLRVGFCLSRAWSLIGAQGGVVLGATFLVWLMSFVAMHVPLLGPMAWWVLHGVFYGGLYLVLLRAIRGEATSAGGILEGFNLASAQLMLAGIVTSLLTQLGFLCCTLPGLYLLVAWKFSLPLVADKRLEFWSAMELSRKVVTRMWFPVCGLLLVAFLPTLIAFAWQCAVMMKVFMPIVTEFWQMTAAGRSDYQHLVPMLEACQRSILPTVYVNQLILMVNLPYALSALMYAYEDLFGARTETRA